MDWSSVFDDQGEEEGDWEREDVSSTRTGLIDALIGANGNCYSPLICYAFTVNYILGVGCLGIPYAFLKSGIILGSVLVLVLSLVSYVTVMWVASSAQQENQLRAYQNSKNPFVVVNESSKHNPQYKTPDNSFYNYIFGVRNDEGLSLMGSNRTSPTPGTTSTSLYSSISESMARFSSGSVLESKRSSDNQLDSSRNVSPRDAKSGGSIKVSSHTTVFPAFDKGSVSSSNALSFSFVDKTKLQQSANAQHHQSQHVHEIEVTDLAREVLGPTGRATYQAALMLLTYVGLLAYTQVFNGTFISQIYPQCNPVVPPLLFGAIVIPLSCFDLAEQITLQLVMSLLRFVSLGILLFGTVAAIWLDPSRSGVASAASMSTTAESLSTPLIQWSGFGVMFTTAIFSQLFQHSVPGLVRPLSLEDRKHIPQIFKYALMTTASIYIATGIACVVFFGDRLHPSVNLNFVDFDWGYDETHVRGRDYSEWTRLCISALAMTVVLFPALDTLSVFPLIANTLGNNLNSAFPFLRDRITTYYHTQHDTHKQHIKSTSLDDSVCSAKSVCHQDRAAIRRITLTVWRLVAAIPPLIASLAVTNLMFSLQLAGLCGIVVALVTPALLQRYGHDRYAQLPRSLQAMDNAVLSFCEGNGYSTTVLMLAGVAIVICVLQMFS